jgi:predicted amidophosphoribosyltransferase
MLAGFEGVQCLIDDVLVTGTTKDEHDHRLRKVLSRLQEKGVTLNQQKC